MNSNKEEDEVICSHCKYIYNIKRDKVEFGNDIHQGNHFGKCLDCNIVYCNYCLSRYALFIECNYCDKRWCGKCVHSKLNDLFQCNECILKEDLNQTEEEEEEEPHEIFQ